jgi:hypothetical protein
METGSVTIPAGVCYVAYTVMGAGNCSCAAACAGGGGGGFSHYDGALSCSSAFDVCAKVGISCNGCGCSTCVSGFSTGTICASGAVNSNVGCGVGGLINTCGGTTGGSFGGGGGAGGIFGNGGNGGAGSSATIIGGGGGMGSGGGGGG